ncbi:hypothetical protein [Polycladidibacter hongkongensis]|uniref:hypothetical protein n=1 Tax=Polycladidibacter hongkongensis TaxID=1647556 RepID=UPI000830BA80|nr:hypothetical protein [Pseudovibrio hongkongensis]
MKPQRKPLTATLMFSLGLLLPISNALAADATLLTPSVCQDTNNLLTTEWLRKTVDSNEIYYMDEGGTVTNINSQSQAKFDDATFVYVIAHGAVNKVGDWPGEVFASYLKKAHPSKMDFIYVTSCEAAGTNAGTQNSVLRSLEKTINNSNTLYMGFEGCSFLATDGSLDITKGQLTDRGKFLPQQEAAPNENAMTIANLKPYWNTLQGVTQTLGDQTMKKYCETALNKADMAALSEFMKAFNTVFIDGSEQITYPPHNSLRAASFWKAEGEPVTCGGTTKCPSKN